MPAVADVASGRNRVAFEPFKGEVYRETADLTDLKRLATPEEVARAALFLASDLASAVTGVTLDVSCGEFHGY